MMEADRDNKLKQEEIFSRVVRAGKRTYFFDVKAMKSEEHYLTITESKRRFNNDQGKFYYEKHKLFLYKEDFEKFTNAYKESIDFIETGKTPEEPVKEYDVNDKKNTEIDVKFEDLKSENED